MNQQTESFSGTQIAQNVPAWSSEEAVRILDDIRRAVTRNPGTAKAQASRLVSLLSLPAAARTEARGGLAPWQMRKIERYVREHLNETLPVEDLADQVSLSASYFHHAFKHSFETSPHVYVTRLRLKSAQAMMRSTAEPLSQIAFACGFADQSHLCKIFRRELGEPPGVWRRRNATARPPEVTRAARTIAAGGRKSEDLAQSARAAA
jgi:transcriptional regulator GlxA family with amidase domain